MYNKIVLIHFEDMYNIGGRKLKNIGEQRYNLFELVDEELPFN